ncbi:MAG: hypothetical protein AAFX80_24835, partial [Cyanobacteria bacterium J06639_18]
KVVSEKFFYFYPQNGILANWNIYKAVPFEPFQIFELETLAIALSNSVPNNLEFNWYCKNKVFW